MNTRSKQPAKVISISSGKGGVGKTNTTVNLGLALTKMGRKVLLLDADLGLANINILLGFKPAASIHELLQGRAMAKDIIVHHSSGLDIIPAASGIPQLTNLTEDERLSLVSAFDEFAQDYDYMLVDTAAGIGDNVLYFNAAAEQVLIVIDNEPTSITDAYALIKVLASQWNSKEFDVVVNRAPVGNDGRETFAKLASATSRFLTINLNYLGAIAEDRSMGEAVVRQVPLVELYPNTKAARDFNRLAKKLDSFQGSRKAKGGLQFFFQELVASMQ